MRCGRYISAGLLTFLLVATGVIAAEGASTTSWQDPEVRQRLVTEVWSLYQELRNTIVVRPERFDRLTYRPQFGSFDQIPKPGPGESDESVLRRLADLTPSAEEFIRRLGWITTVDVLRDEITRIYRQSRLEHGTRRPIREEALYRDIQCFEDAWNLKLRATDPLDSPPTNQGS